MGGWLVEWYIAFELAGWLEMEFSIIVYVRDFLVLASEGQELGMLRLCHLHREILTTFCSRSSRLAISFATYYYLP